MKISLKDFLRILKIDAGTSTRKMSEAIGLNNQTLYRKQTTGTLTVKELQRCLECNSAELIVVYKEVNYEIERV